MLRVSGPLPLIGLGTRGVWFVSTGERPDDGGAPLIEVGRVVKPHGLRGEVAVHLLTDRPQVRFATGAEVVVDGRTRDVASSRPHQGRWLVRFTGVTDRDGAEALRGAQLTAQPLDGDDDTETFWVHELVGMVVLTEDSQDLGDVASVVEMPPAAGYDLLEVTHPAGHTWWLPAVDELVQVVEADDGDDVLVVVDPPPGLWDGDQQVALQPGELVHRPLVAGDTATDDGAPADGADADDGVEAPVVTEGEGEGEDGDGHDTAEDA